MIIRPVVFIGPSGSGKSTLAHNLIQHQPSLTLVRTYTTRPQRVAEDTTHHFVDDDRYNDLLRMGAFVGTLELFGYRYGLPHLTSDGLAPLLLLRAPAISTLRQLYPNSIVIEIEAPYDVLRVRLEKRGDYDRIDKKKLEQEMRIGRAVSDVTVDTCESIALCLAKIKRALET